DGSVARFGLGAHGRNPTPRTRTGGLPQAQAVADLPRKTARPSTHRGGEILPRRRDLGGSRQRDGPQAERDGPAALPNASEFDRMCKAGVAQGTGRRNFQRGLAQPVNFLYEWDTNGEE